MFLRPPHHAKSYLDYLKDCVACPDDKKRKSSKRFWEPLPPRAPRNLLVSRLWLPPVPQWPTVKSEAEEECVTRFHQVPRYMSKWRMGMNVSTCNALLMTDQTRQWGFTFGRVSVQYDVEQMSKLYQENIREAFKSGSETESFLFSLAFYFHHFHSNF